MAGGNVTNGSGARQTPLKLNTAIIGAGVAGLYQLYLLREQGLKVRAFDSASGVGGTWYWNRYPARNSIPRPTSTSTCSRKSSTRDGAGASGFPGSPKSSGG